MPPHAAPLDDQIEIEALAGNHCSVRYEQIPSPKGAAPRSQGTVNNRNHGLATLSQDSVDSITNNRVEVDTRMLALERSDTIDSADQYTIYDSFTQMCAPDCSGYPRKSAMRSKKAPRGSISTGRSVSFNSLTVREYDLTLGDHPSSASGPPVQLNWEHKAENTMDLNDYEQMRQPRRKRRQLKMSFQEREEILQSSGFTMDQLKNAWMESLKVRQQRYETVMTGSLTTKMEEAWESTCRKFNRLFTLSGDQEGFEVQAEGQNTPTQWSYVSAENEAAPAPSNWSLFEGAVFGAVPPTTTTAATPAASTTKRVGSTGNSTLISV
mmetsp:Transcript_473/g.763  ORF Transcript_473/g.763 Transcript_473/m.763 type:complete len:324 (-) Transcript_473:254-1225(-)|eukprot:CAMPEP_0119017306 /NCGR_PEP_ID=MMETSP1176-20130426/16101_1 /TAXON_ID=265551 /ORGANISM="Synedropsis recta cf, Strain CCMP1620" /LENGTH=323 /DNA_ID=CAMNT_0006970991 /DNA_START=112 /DNA_END=1083 /DNA_ORIENTATION=-